MHTILADGWGYDAWAWLVVPIGIYCVCSLALFAFGRNDRPGFSNFFFGQISDSLRRLTGFPGWAMAGVLSGLLFLLILVIGFYWDVAWHIDNGRDTQLFTPSHAMILVGLGGLVYAAFLTMGFATLDKARVGFKYGVANVPWSSVLLLCLGFGGMAAFPLDNLWHETYGIDVTLWSPTHLMLVGGGALGTVALFLMLAEALPFARPTAVGRGIFVLTGGTVLVALSAVQAEFDYGVPQFQALYLPLLIMVAAGLGLVLARIALGPWGAVKVVYVYLGLRVFLALVVGGVFHHTVPRFPLYLASALAVEGAAALVGTRSRLRFGLVAGALVGTVGLIGELAWVRASGWAPVPMPSSMAVKVFLLGPVAAVAAALLGAGLGRAFASGGGVGAGGAAGGGGGGRMPVAALVGAGVALVAVLAYPLPRNVGSVDAVVRTEVVAGDRAFVEVTLDPPGAADDASGFAVTSWQGGGRVTSFFDEVEPGRYRSEKSVPVTGDWKTVVSLQRGSEVMAAPVYLPADPSIGAEAVPLVPERSGPFVRNTTLLLREQHPGPQWPAVVVWIGFVTALAVWIGLMAVTAVRVRGGRGDASDTVDGAGRTTDWSTVGIGRSLAPHGR
ncbi:MAG: hypothetical protein QOG82_51 [Actinomycetota bacterium]|nr:hypothetical protein [Actinomycetota bacterium]